MYQTVRYTVYYYLFILYCIIVLYYYNSVCADCNNVTCDFIVFAETPETIFANVCETVVKPRRGFCRDGRTGAAVDVRGPYDRLGRSNMSGRRNNSRYVRRRHHGPAHRIRRTRGENFLLFS